MPAPKKGASLGARPNHQRLMLRNLASALFEHERVKTTEAKAKLLSPFAERLITKAKDGSVHQRRQVLSMIEDRDVVHKLFDDIAQRFSQRNGGYTRVMKLGPRNGDGAPMALIELIEEGRAVVPEGGEEVSTRRRRLRRPARRRQPDDSASVPASEEDVPPAAESEETDEVPEPDIAGTEEGQRES